MCLSDGPEYFAAGCTPERDVDFASLRDEGVYC
jgi:hypothetical protein